METETGITYIKGRKINQRKLRKFLDDLDVKNIDQFEIEDGKWESPITGELFDTKSKLWGHLGPYLRKGYTRLDPREPTRAGYVRALRQGLDPTDAQREAHAEYNRAYRRKRRNKVLEARGQDPLPDPEPIPEPVKVPEMTWD